MEVVIVAAIHIIYHKFLYISFINTNKFFTDLSRLRIDIYSQSKSEKLYCERRNKNIKLYSWMNHGYLDFNNSFLFFLLHNIDNDLLQKQI